MMRRRLVFLLLVCASLCLAQTPYERLAAAAKLWAYVKYLHPRVTAPDVDWDAAFAKTAPQIVAAHNDQEFSSAVGGMLAVLNDPMTRIMPPMAEMMAGADRVLPVTEVKDGITVVRMEKGGQGQAMQARNSLTERLRGKEPLVFDLRGVKMASYILPQPPAAVPTTVGPSLRFRVHNGYEPEDRSGSGGYRSMWQMEGIARPAEAGSRPVVFLVNHQTNIPQFALALQNSSEAAIISEDPVSDNQLDYLSRPLWVLGSLQAIVRVEELAWDDGTTGLIANLILNKTGDEALREAMELARTGKWPPPAARPKSSSTPARFTEKSYGDRPYPDAGYRMMSAARIWGVFHYFHPYRHLYGEDWDALLPAFLEQMAKAETAREYHLAVAEMVAHTHDSHCSVNSPELNAYYGVAATPIELRWIENQPVVTRVDASLGGGLQPGDVLTKIDGEPYQKRVDDLEKHVAASTAQSMTYRVAGRLLTGPDGSRFRVAYRRGAEPEREIELVRERANMQKFFPYRTGDVFRLVQPKIGYVDLARLPNAQVDAMFEKFKETDAIIMDMRGYPQGTAWSIAPRLAEKPALVAAQFRRNVVSPDAPEGNNVTSMLFEQHIPVNGKPRYPGKTVMLIDERAISQSEHSGLFYKTANSTVFIGSPTQGANGDVTWFTAPGGIRINFSGHDVRWPDGKQLQRVGLAPDIEVRPTIEGIRAGRDEVLERAVEYLEKGR